MRPRKLITRHDVFLFIYLYPLRRLASLLPPQAIRLIGKPLAYIYGLLPVSRPRRQAVRRIMNLVFDNTQTTQETGRSTRQCLHNFVNTFIQDLSLDRLNRTDLLERGIVRGFEHLENALRRTRGAILVGAHFSGDRIGKLWLRAKGHPVLCVRTRSPANPAMSVVKRKFLFPALVASVNEALQDCVFIEDAGFSLEILRWLRRNGLVSVLIDSGLMGTVKGIPRPFHGQPFIFPTYFLRIARLTGAAIIPAVFIGDSSSFSLTFDQEFILRSMPDQEEFLSVNLDRLVKTLELQFSRYPGHWVL